MMTGSLRLVRPAKTFGELAKGSEFMMAPDVDLYLSGTLKGIPLVYRKVVGSSGSMAVTAEGTLVGFPQARLVYKVASDE